MNTLPKDIQLKVKEVGESLAGSQLPVGLARLYSHQTKIGAGQPGLISWRDKDTAYRMWEAEKLLEAAFLKREIQDQTWKRDLRRSAEIFEWLSVTKSVNEKVPLILLSAAAYQLAGFPARAFGILRSENLKEYQSKIIESFLKADFLGLQSKITTYWRDTMLENEIESSDSTVIDKLGTFIINETIRSLGVISSWFRWGEETRINKALEKIHSISYAMLYGPELYSWLLAKLVADVAKEYLISSLRKNIEETSLYTNEAGKIAIERYSRLAFLTNSALAWPSQIDGLKKIKSGISFALCTPTGSGKTRIAEMAILEALFHKDNSDLEDDAIPIALYLVPSRALAAEIESKLAQILRYTGGEQIVVTSLYGGADWGTSDAFLDLSRRSVVISTHEKADALMRFLGSSFVDRIKIVIVDESHTVEYEGSGDDLRDSVNRALHLETLVSRLITRLHEKDCRFIALSAVAPGIDEDLASWVSQTPGTKAVRTQYRSTRQLLGRLLCFPNRKVQIRYDLLDGQNLAITGSADESPYIPEPFPPYPPATQFENAGPEKKLRPHIFWTAMNLAKRDNSGKFHSVLISVTQQPGGFAEDFLKLLEDIWKDEDLPSFYSEPETESSKKKYIKCLKSCKDYFGEKSREYRLLSYGIVMHHGKMPGVMSRMLVELIQEGIVNIVIATSTLTEGVNLPFEIILIPSLRRSGRYVSDRELANLIGRAGRPGTSIEGRSLVILDPYSTSMKRDAL